MINTSAFSENKVIKLVCNDTTDPSLPLSIEIHNYDGIQLGRIGKTIVDLTVNDVMYTLEKKDDVSDIFGTIQRNDGRFSLDMKIGKGTSWKYRGFCKINNPKF